MNGLFDKLNLRPQERRLVVIVGIVVFVVLNFWLVIPMFGDYGRYQQRANDAGKKLGDYKQEIQKRPAYEKELKELESQGGYVPTEEAGLRLGQEVNSQAILSGVTMTGGNAVQRQGGAGKTNFFEEAAMTVNFNSGEKELIDFLYRLADKDLLIRAKAMVIGSDPSQMRLQGQITLVKSFQRRPPPKAAATAAATTKPAAAAATPAATGASSPAPKVEAPPKPAATPPPTVAPANPTPAPAPPSSGAITNRSRRALPAPVKP